MVIRIHRFVRCSVLLLASFLLAACSAPPAEEPPPPAVLVRTVDTAQADSGMRVYTGEVRARIETDLGFRIGGKLVERRVDVGATVTTGQILAVLDAEDARLAARAAAASVAAAVADLALARSEFERSTELRRREFISESALDASRTAMQAAEARLHQARAQADTAENQTEYTRLIATADGVVTSVTAEAGQVVAAGQVVVRIAQPGEREVLIHLPESRVGALAVGAAALVRPWADVERSYPGRVREVAPAADSATRSYAVRVAVPAADEGLKLGATASVAFAGKEEAGVLLPLPAVTRIDGQARVWVVDEASTVRPLKVELGAFREDGVLVTAGLPSSARVVVAGVNKLLEGSKVRPVEEGAPVQLDVAR